MVGSMVNKAEADKHCRHLPSVGGYSLRDHAEQA